MDPFTLALLGSTAASALSSGAGYAASQRAAGTQAQAAQTGGMLGYIAQQQALEEARRRTDQAAAAVGDYYNRGTGDIREFYGKGRADLLEQGRAGEATAREFYGQGVGFQQPYMTAGAGATNQLAQLYGPGGDYTKMPTIAQIEMDPSYAWRTQQGQQALLNATRAGVGGANVGSGAAGKAFINYGQNAASQEYSNAYARFMENRLRATQGLQNLAGTGAGAAGTATNLAGSVGNALSGNQFNLGSNLGQAATTAGSNLGTMASNAGATTASAYTGAIPQLAALSAANPYAAAIENVGQARASGYMGGASALQNALQTPVNAMMAYGMMDRFAPQNRTSTYAPNPNFNRTYAPGFTPGFQGAPTFGAPGF